MLTYPTPLTMPVPTLSGVVAPPVQPQAVPTAPAPTAAWIYSDPSMTPERRAARMAALQRPFTETRDQVVNHSVRSSLRGGADRLTIALARQAAAVRLIAMDLRGYCNGTFRFDSIR